jgi:hypothetical protein
MGLVKEPEGVDFIIQSPPLNEEEKNEISEFIRTRKLQNNSKGKQAISKKKIRGNVKEKPKV